jgi:phosphoglycolate phosphatase-like HAD superfamily hydrolase
VIRGTIFDLEGTLIKLPIDYSTLYENIRKELKLTKVRPLTRTIKTLNEESRIKIFRLWEKAELKALPFASVNEEGMKLYRMHSNKSAALVTMQGRNIVKKILETFQLSFRILITREDCVDRAGQIQKAINEMHLDPSSVLMVGDRENDRAATRKIGCDFIKVRT